MKLCRFVFLFASLCVLTTVTLKIPESAGKDHLVSILDIRHLLHVGWTDDDRRLGHGGGCGHGAAEPGEEARDGKTRHRG